MKARLLFGMIGVGATVAALPAEAQYAVGRCVVTRGLERTLRDFQARARQANGTPGMVATVFDKDGVVATAAAGIRSLNTGEALTGDDSFNLGSHTKHLLAVSVGQLVDQGRLSYDARIGELLPDMAASMQPAFRDATVRQLLFMTAGFGAYNGTDPERTGAMLAAFAAASGGPAERRDQFTRFLLASEPDYAPGEGQVYSNAGFAVLGTIYERLVARPYELAAVDSVFGRVGATASFGIPRDLGPANPSVHLAVGDGTLVAIDDPAEVTNALLGRLPPELAPAGGMVATMPAFAKVEQQLLRASMGLSQPLASAAALRGLFELVGELGAGGIVTSRITGRTTHFFEGSTTGGHAFSFLVPTAGIGVVFASNSGVNPFTGVADTQEDGYALMMALAERARRGVLVARSADQGAVFGEVEASCAASKGDLFAVTRTFGDLTSEQASALAERIAPDDSRLIDRLSAASLEAMADQVETHMSVGGSAFRGRLADSGEGRWRAFLAGGALGGRAIADAAAPGADIAGWASSWGFTGPVGDRLRAGIAFSYARARARLAGGSGSTRLTSPQIALALAYDGGNGLFGDFRAMLARQSVRTERDLAIEGLDPGTARARRTAIGSLVDASIGYAVGGRLRIAPIVGLRFIGNNVDRAEESGSALALTIDRRHSHRLDARAGLSIATGFELGGAMVRPSVEAFHVRTIADRRPDLVARFAEGGGAMRFAPAPIDRAWTSLRAGIDIDAGPAAFQLGATGAIGRDGRDDLRLMGGTRVRF